MKVGINATILDPAPSGLGRYTANVTNQLAEILADYLVFSSCSDGLAVPRERYFGVSPRVRPSLGRWGHAARWAWLQLALPRILGRQGIEVLLSTVPEGIIFPPVRQIVVVHDLSPLVFPDAYPRLYHYYRYVVPRLLQSSDAVVCVSEFTRREVIRRYRIEPSKTRVVYESACLSRTPGGEASQERQKLDLGRFLLCVASELSPRKNLGFLLSAIAPILRKSAELTLAIVGKKDPRFLPQLESVVEREGLNGRVRFLGYVGNTGLAALYRGAELLLFSSTYEGFGLPILEAMAFGTPVVTFDTSCIPEIAGGAAELVPLNRPNELVAAVDRILEDPGYARRLAEKGLARAREFSWEKAARELAAIIADLQ